MERKPGESVGTRKSTTGKGGAKAKGGWGVPPPVSWFSQLCPLTPKGAVSAWQVYGMGPRILVPNY